ncbi:MAG: TVP38/TMEM64 family protein [Eubacteriales bacterium]|nr:TVP38/TMEM64 family protein [Eubacteriales bacterium]
MSTEKRTNSKESKKFIEATQQSTTDYGIREENHRKIPNHQERKAFRKDLMQGVHSNLQETSKRERRVAFGKLMVLGVILIVIPVLLTIYCRDTLLSTDFWNQLPSKLSSHPLLSALALVALQIIQIVICILPGQPIQLASSYMYGVFGGYCIAIIGATLGCMVTYQIAHFLGSDAMHLMFGKEKVASYMRKLNSSKALTIVFLIYLVPGIPKDLVSYIAGISDIELKPFLLVSTLGRSPGILGSLLIGSFWSSKNYTGIAVVAAVMLFLLVWCVRNRKDIMKKIESYEEEQ